MMSIRNHSQKARLSLKIVVMCALLCASLFALSNDLDAATVAATPRKTAFQSIRCAFSSAFSKQAPEYCKAAGKGVGTDAAAVSLAIAPAPLSDSKPSLPQAVPPKATSSKSQASLPVATTTTARTKGAASAVGITRSELDAALRGIRAEILRAIPAGTASYAAPAPATYYGGGYSVPAPNTASTDYVSQQTAAVPQPWTSNGSALYYSGGNVGIGTTTPTRPLSIVLNEIGAGTTLDQLYLQHTKTGNNYAYAGMTIDHSNGAATTKGGSYIRFYNSGTGGNAYIKFDYFNGDAGATALTTENIVIENDTPGNITFQTTATERMRIMGTGNVGIGTTTPSAKLSVKGSGTGTGKAFVVTDSSDIERVTILDNGNVGIGTTTPEYPIDLVGTIASRDFQNSAFTGAFLRLMHARGGTAATPLAVASSDRLGAVLFQGHDGSSFLTSATIESNVDGTVATGSVPTSIRFFTTAVGSGSRTERLRIDNAGNIGIGTTTPSANLEISASGGPSLRLSRTGAFPAGILDISAGSAGATINSFGTLALLAGNGVTGINMPASGRVTIGGGAQDVNRLGVAANAAIGSSYYNVAAPTNGLIVEGNLGVGNTNPLNKLSVTGNADVSGNLSIGTASNPGYPLYVYGNNTDIAMAFFSGGPTKSSLIALGRSSSDLSIVVPGINGTYDNGAIAGDTVFRTNAGNYRFAGAGGTNLLTIMNGGNVGIGTAAPAYLVDVRGTGATINVQGGGSAGDTSKFSLTQSANPASYVGSSIVSTRGSGADANLSFEVSNGASRVEYMRILGSSGNVGIGTTTPSAQLTNTGTVRFAALGSAGASLITDSLGNVTVSSDERLKDVQGKFESGLDRVLMIDPITYRWKSGTGYDTEATYAGFSAQNVRGAIPEAVSTDSRGFLTLADRPILAALVNAVKELARSIESLATHFKTKFFEAEDIQAEKLCLGTVCITETELRDLLQSRGMTGAPGIVPAPTLAPTSTSTLIIAPDQAITNILDAVLESVEKAGVSAPTPTPDPVSVTDPVSAPITETMSAPEQVVPAPSAPIPPAVQTEM